MFSTTRGVGWNIFKILFLVSLYLAVCLDMNAVYGVRFIYSLLWNPFFPPYPRVKMWLGAVCLEGTELRERCVEVDVYLVYCRGGGGWTGECLSLSWTVCVWSVSECILRVLWIEREFSTKKIKLNFWTRYIAYLIYSCFVDINWTANTLIRMCRDVGHGRPRFSSDTREKSILKKLKMRLPYGGAHSSQLWRNLLNALCLKRNPLHPLRHPPLPLLHGPLHSNLERTIFNWATVFIVQFHFNTSQSRASVPHLSSCSSQLFQAFIFIFLFCYSKLFWTMMPWL